MELNVVKMPHVMYHLLTLESLCSNAHDIVAIVYHLDYISCLIFHTIVTYT